MTYQAVPDPWDVASNPENYQQDNDYFGEVSISAWTCALVKGVGKVPYDPNIHAELKPQTAIDLSISPLAESNLQFDVTRQMIGTFGDWPKVTWPSAKVLGVLNASELNGKFAHVEMVNTGTYQKNGETKDLTAIKFVQLFDTREECAAAYKMKHGGNGSVSEQQQPLTDNNEKTVALTFVGPLIGKAKQQAEGDLGKMRELLAKEIANQSMINKYFTVDSPEIVELMAKELEK